ncbi:MAG: hypothetical protein IKO19_00035 [Candidatus Riflebacteria bacterium]|nr:hypothetical protein [Candidatus Riflebacteria bacterium]
MFKKYKIITTILFLILTVAAQAAENELTFWNFWDPKLIVPVIEAFEKENPGVKIHNEQLTWNNGLDKLLLLWLITVHLTFAKWAQPGWESSWRKVHY